MQADEGPAPRRRGWLRAARRPLRRIVIIFILVLIIEYLVIPELVGASKDLYLLGRVAVGWLIAGLVLEAASLFCYALLTRALLPPHRRPGISRLFRIDLAAAAVAHVIPAGTVGSAGVGYQLFTSEGLRGTDVGVMMATKGMGSTVVLNVLLWLALVISIPLSGFRPVYATVAIVGAVLLAAIAALVVGLTRGGTRAARIVRAIGDKIPRVGGERLEKIALQVSESLRRLTHDRKVLISPGHAGRTRRDRLGHPSAAGELRPDQERRDPRRAHLAAGELLAAHPDRRGRVCLDEGAQRRRPEGGAPGSLRADGEGRTSRSPAQPVPAQPAPAQPAPAQPVPAQPCARGG